MFTVRARPAARLRGHSEKLKALPRRLRQRLQRQWKRSLAGLALLLALGQANYARAALRTFI